MRLEIETLRRALLADRPEQARRLARAAGDLRRARIARLDPAAAGYERGTELKEGLAAYLEGVAAGVPDGQIGLGPFPADEARARSYASGPLIARLLDRVAPGWKERLERGDADSLAALLPEGTGGVDAGRCGPSAGERAAAVLAARDDVSKLEARRRNAREAFLAAPGWIVVVEAEGEPLWPKGFDPLNLRRVSPREVLHTRWVRLGNAAGEIEIFDRPSLTLAAGPHPLFQGIRRLTVSGVTERPSASESGGIVIVRAPGISLRLEGAHVETAGTTVRIVLGAPAL